MSLEQVLINGLTEITELPPLEVGKLIPVSHIATMWHRSFPCSYFYMLGVFRAEKDRPYIVCVDVNPNGNPTLKLLDEKTLYDYKYLDLRSYELGTRIMLTHGNGFILIPPEN